MLPLKKQLHAGGFCLIIHDDLGRLVSMRQEFTYLRKDVN